MGLIAGVESPAQEVVPRWYHHDRKLMDLLGYLPLPDFYELVSDCCPHHCAQYC